MVFINDLLDFKNRNLYLMLNGKKIPMRLQFYVIDDIFFFEVDENAKLSTLDELRTVLESEAEDKCWGDIYTAPMEKISNCEIRFPKKYNDVISNDIFDDCYTITKIETTLNDIIIWLK